jgi:hypothetical protein
MIFWDQGKLDFVGAAVSRSQRRVRVWDLVERFMKDPAFTLTDALLAPEPYRSDQFEHLDNLTEQVGVMTQGNSPDGTWRVRVLMAHALPELDPQDPAFKSTQIKSRPWSRRRLPGTTNTVATKSEILWGNVGWVDCTWPDRTARVLLAQMGYPLVEIRGAAAGTSSHSGQVVEIDYLARVANEPDALPETIALWQEIQSRPNYQALVAPVAPTTTAAAAAIVRARTVRA